jgi:tetrahydromethanopterin S-methyltransferase subunit F
VTFAALLTAGFVGLIVGGVAGLAIGSAAMDPNDFGFVLTGFIGACAGIVVPFVIAAAWPLRDRAHKESA